MKAHPKSKDARCSNLSSPSTAEMYDDLLFGLGELLRTGRGRMVLYNFRRSGWKVTRSPRYGKLPRKFAYWASDKSCQLSASEDFSLRMRAYNFATRYPSIRQEVLVFFIIRIRCWQMVSSSVQQTIHCTHVSIHYRRSRTCTVQRLEIQDSRSRIQGCPISKAGRWGVHVDLF